MKVHTLKSLLTGIIAIFLFSLLSLGSSAGDLASIRKQRSTELPNRTFYSNLATLRPLSSILALDATVATDKSDYPIGATVVISGSGWQAAETVTLQVTDNLSPTDPNQTAHQPWDVVADADGNISSSWIVDEDANNLTLTLTAHGQTSSLDALTTFTDANPSANLDQCANDPSPSPSSDGCDSDANQWVNGNLGASKSVYQEGDSIPYRLSFDNLPLSSHTVTIEWDTTKSSTHAIDYITTFNRSVLDADPCLGVSGCGSPTTFPIPKDPQVDNGSGSPITQAAGNFTMYGGTITGVSAYSYATGAGFTGDKSARITITFTASQANPVLAWGGHIAQRRAGNGSGGWGDLLSAVNIPGSPYHTRLIDLDGSGGNQDRSLSAEAVIFPGSITIIKDASPNGPTSFPFTASPSPLSNFSLVDDGTAANTKVFSNIVDFQTYTVAETAVTGWPLQSLTCSVTSPNGGKQTVTLPSVSIQLEEGENVTCTFVNQEDQNVTRGKIKVVKVTDPSPDPSNTSFTFNPTNWNGVSFTLSNGQSKTSASLIPSDTTHTYSVSEINVPTGWTSDGGVCDHGTPANITVVAGQITTCTFTNTRDTGSLKLSKSLTGGPAGYTGPFTIAYDCDDGTAHDGTVSVSSGSSQTIAGIPTGTSCTVSETPPAAPTGYTFGAPTFSPAATVAITTKGATVEVTTNNTLTRDTGSLKLSKALTGGPAGYTGPFTIHYDCGTGFIGDKTVAAGSFDTVISIPTGTSCTVSETPPTPPTGYSFGTPTFSPQATVTITTKGATVEVTTNNTLTRDQGYFKIKKVFDPLISGFAGNFSITYNCGAGDHTVSLAAGATSAAIGPFDTGTSCAVSEPSTPTAPAGWTFGTPSVSGSPVTIVKDTAATTASLATVTNSISRDQGYLKISKVFDAKTSGFAGTFTIHYNCGGGDQTVSLAAGGSQTFGPFDTGTSCAVTEPTLPSAPSGWTFGTPSISGSPATITKGDAAAAVAVSVTNSITRDRGYLKISKVFDPLTSGFAGNFTIHYNCGSGDQTVSLAAGGSQTFGPFDTGTSCAVTEPTLPSAPSGWTFGTPSISGSPATITKGDAAAAVAVSVTNSITRDQGYLKISKVFDAKTSGFAGTFAIHYNCGGGDQTVNLAAGGSQTFGPFDTGTSCAVTEPTLPTAPSGWAFGTPSISGSPATITKGDAAAAVAVTVTNSITRDQGYLKISKVFDPLTSGFAGNFTIHYNCGGGDQTVSLAAGGSQTFGPFDTGTSCAVTEPSTPTAPTGWTFGTPSISGSPATITKGDAAAAVAVTVTNSITRDQGYLKISKVFDPLTSGFAGNFTIHYNCGGGDQTVSLAAGGSQTFGPFDTGTSCSVTEPSTPTAPTGWTFGTPSISGSPATITKGDEAAAVAVSVTNTISRDLGNLKLSKSLTGGPAGYTGPFTIGYNCDDGTHIGTKSVSAGGYATVTGIPTGTNCTVSETPPAAPTGYTFGTPTFSPSATVAITTKGATVEVMTNNTLTRDTGSLRILKTVSNPDGASVPASFTVNYNCGTGYTGQVSVTPGSPATVNGIPTGNSCSVTEVAPSAIANYTWGTITYSPASVAISTKGATFDITVGNSITRDRGTIVIIKNAKPAQGSFAFTTTSSGTGSGYNGFTLTGSTASGGNQNSQTLPTGDYTAKEGTQLGWILTGIGGAGDPNPYNCTVSGSGGSTGVGSLNTMTVSISLKKGDTVTCVFENTGNGATRTQGFWATHSQLANIAWFGGTAYGHTFPGVAGLSGIGDKTLCGRPIDTLGKLMGGFWSGISSTSTGKKRSALDQARMQLLQQLLSAELNASAFGSAPGSGSFTAWESAYCGTNQNAIQTAQQQAGSFNNSGDSSTFTPGTSADSKNARAIATYTFWDTLP